jgi:hypothetical protein
MPPVTSSPASTPELDPLEVAGYRDLISKLAGELVGLVTEGVRWWRARRRPWLPPHVWVATDDDEAAIGGPLGRLAARHAPVSGAGSEDLVDGVTLVMSTGRYGLRNFREEDLADRELAAQIANLPTADVEDLAETVAAGPSPQAPPSGIASRLAR